MGLSLLHVEVRALSRQTRENAPATQSGARRAGGPYPRRYAPERASWRYMTNGTRVVIYITKSEKQEVFLYGKAKEVRPEHAMRAPAGVCHGFYGKLEWQSRDRGSVQSEDLPGLHFLDQVQVWASSSFWVRAARDSTLPGSRFRAWDRRLPRSG